MPFSEYSERLTQRLRRHFVSIKHLEGCFAIPSYTYSRKFN